MSKVDDYSYFPYEEISVEDETSTTKDNTVEAPNKSIRLNGPIILRLIFVIILKLSEI